MGDRHDHAGDGHGHHLGIPGLRRQNTHDGQRQDHQPADHRDPAGIADKSPLVPVNVGSRQKVQGSNERKDPHDPPGPVAKAELGHRGIVLETKEDELLLADRLSLFDQDLAARVGVIMVGDAVAAPLPEAGPWPRPRTTKSRSHRAGWRQARRGSDRCAGG